MGKVVVGMNKERYPRRHAPFSPYVAPRFPHMSGINAFFRFFLPPRRLQYRASEEAKKTRVFDQSPKH